MLIRAMVYDVEAEVPSGTRSEVDVVTYSAEYCTNVFAHGPAKRCAIVVNGRGRLGRLGRLRRLARIIKRRTCFGMSCTRGRTRD